MPGFEQYSVAQNLTVFAIAAIVLWIAGSRLVTYAEAIGQQTGLGDAFVGALLLGGITSLPELVTTLSAAALGNAPLAVNNVFGGIAMQVAIIALADLVVRGPASSTQVATPTVLLQAALLVVVLAVAAFAMIVGDVAVLRVGVASAALFGGALASFLIIHRHGYRRTWRVDGRPAGTSGQTKHRPRSRGAPQRSAMWKVLLGTAIGGLVIVAAGYVLARVVDVLAAQTGLGASFAGVVLLALATSLPEISTTLAAVRTGALAMAYGNVFGANILDSALIFVADLGYPGPVLAAAGAYSAAVALLGIVLTAVYLVGMIDRRPRTIAGVGFDSMVVFVLYFAGLWVLYAVR